MFLIETSETDSLVSFKRNSTCQMQKSMDTSYVGCLDVDSTIVPWKLR